MQTERSDWIYPRQTLEAKKKKKSCVLSEAEWSVPTERRIPTDLSTAGQVEVDEIAPALPCGEGKSSCVPSTITQLPSDLLLLFPSLKTLITNSCVDSSSSC